MSCSSRRWQREHRSTCARPRRTIPTGSNGCLRRRMPTWEALEDGSKVIGTQIEKTSAPKGGDIPWLLLKRKAGAGKGRFNRVTYIQRVDTERGIAPARTCDKARQGQEVRVKYKATYVFYCAKE